jgi:hypothetical protein
MHRYFSSSSSLLYRENCKKHKLTAKNFFIIKAITGKNQEFLRNFKKEL